MIPPQACVESHIAFIFQHLASFYLVVLMWSAVPPSILKIKVHISELQNKKKYKKKQKKTTCDVVFESIVAWGATALTTWKTHCFQKFPIQCLFPGKLCRHIAQNTCQLHHSFSALRQCSQRGYCHCVALITKQVLGVHANSIVYSCCFSFEAVVSMSPCTRDENARRHRWKNQVHVVENTSARVLDLQRKPWEAPYIYKSENQLLASESSRASLLFHSIKNMVGDVEVVWSIL